MKGHRVGLEEGVLSQEAQAGSAAPRALWFDGEGVSAGRWGLGQMVGRPVVSKPLYTAENSLERLYPSCPHPQLGILTTHHSTPEPTAETTSVASRNATDTGLFCDKIKVQGLMKAGVVSNHFFLIV